MSGSGDLTFVVRTPRCPLCDAEPAFVGILPWFCSNDACGLVSWNPDETPEQNRARIVAVHDLTCPLALTPLDERTDPDCHCRDSA